MKLNIGIIAEALTPSLQYICGTPEHRLLLSDVRFLLPEKKPYQRDMLYFTEWSKLKTMETDLPPYLVCVGGGAEALRLFRRAGLTGIIMDEEDPLVVFSAIQSILHKYNQMESNLLAALRAKATTREIMNLCADIFQNHVILYDTDRNLIDYSTRFAPDPEEPYWKETLETGRRSEKLMAEVRKHGTNLQAIRTKYSDYVDLGPGLPKLIMYHLFENGERLSTLTISETNKPLSTCHLQLLDYIAELLSPSLLAISTTSHGSLKGLRDILTSLLDREPVDPLLLSRLLSTAGWSAGDDFILLLIRFPKAAVTSEMLARYRHIYERIFPDSVALVYIDSLVLLVHNDTAEIMSKYLPRLENQLVQHKARCGLSFPFKGVFQLDAQYKNAEIALRSNAAGGNIRLLSQAITEHIIGQIASETPLFPLCHREAVRLYEYDMENGTDLLLTLETYLRQNKSLKAAAAELFIHRSTMTYRLGCIKKLVNMNLENADERLHILLSCIVLRTLGRMKQAAQPVRSIQRQRLARFKARKPFSSRGKMV